MHAQEAHATLSPRTGHRLVYDSGKDRIILFGGNTVNHERVYYDDTWVLSLSENTWTKLPAEGPSPRGEHAMAYSSDYNKVLLFGGVDPTGRLGDTWVFDCDTDTWTRVETDGSPEGRSDFDMTYDSRNVVSSCMAGGAAARAYNTTPGSSTSKRTRGRRPRRGATQGECMVRPLRTTLTQEELSSTEATCAPPRHGNLLKTSGFTILRIAHGWRQTAPVDPWVDTGTPWPTALNIRVWLYSVVDTARERETRPGSTTSKKTAGAWHQGMVRQPGLYRTWCMSPVTTASYSSAALTTATTTSETLGSSTQTRGSGVS